MNNNKHNNMADAIVCGLEAGLKEDPVLIIDPKKQLHAIYGARAFKDSESWRSISKEGYDSNILKNVLIGNSISHSMYGLFRQEQENIKESQEGSNMEVVDKREKAVVSFKDIKRGQPFEYDGEIYIKMYTVLGKSNAIDLSGLGACFPDPMVVTPLKGKLVIED